MAAAISHLQRNARQFGPKQGAGCGWLVTGFGPFPRVAKNPSAALARDLARRLPGGSAHVFETSYARVTDDIARLAALAPRAVLMLGVAPRAKSLRVELRAINRRAAGARDASGRLPATPLIAPGSPAYLNARHRGAVLVQRLRSTGVDARLSRDAGRYLCNFAYWSMLRALPGVPVVFIHVPLPRGLAKRDARPALPAMARALHAMLRGGL